MAFNQSGPTAPAAAVPQHEDPPGLLPDSNTEAKPPNLAQCCPAAKEITANKPDSILHG